MASRVNITTKAGEVVQSLKQQYGSLVFHQSGGCCDGSAPMCFEEGELFLNETDVLLGHIEECPFYMSQDQFEYWKHTHLTIDVVEGRGASFSLEIPLGLRFIVKSCMLTPEELKQLN
ncbi:DUF779 domain-containing protein [Gangjinia marincola]|uniref:DUF779 domain-containing protein n=1 Tax=Gangjinia marincola TaxID=578463 RepID=A0ABN1MDH9_9FLAO